MTDPAHRLSLLPVYPDRPEAILADLERAIAGEVSLLPVPGENSASARNRVRMLHSTQRVGELIDASVALVVATSGSTGIPKGAQLTAVNLVASADATHQAFGGQGQWLLAMPAHHIAGIQVLIRSLVAGVDPLCLDLRCGFDVAAFARAAHKLGATGDNTYTALTPMQLIKAMDTLEGIEALREFDAILIGGAALSEETARAARELNIHCVTTYGSSETAGGCVYDGVALPGTEIHIDCSGRIWLGGVTIAHGYRNMPDHEAFSHPGWFATSDSGVIDNGRLTILGRIDTIIDTGGLKLHPEVLEKELRTIEGVSDACVVGIPDPRFGQAVVAAYEGVAEPAEIYEALADSPTVERWQWPKQLYRVTQLPRTSLGKLDRRAVSTLF